VSEKRQLSKTRAVRLGSRTSAVGQVELGKQRYATPVSGRGELQKMRLNIQIWMPRQEK
jgi:hypothetical protein